MRERERWRKKEIRFRSCVFFAFFFLFIPRSFRVERRRGERLWMTLESDAHKRLSQYFSITRKNDRFPRKRNNTACWLQLIYYRGGRGGKERRGEKSRRGDFARIAISEPPPRHATHTHTQQLNVTNLAKSFITSVSEALYGMCKTTTCIYRERERREQRAREANERTLGCVMDTQLLYVPAAKNNCIHRAGIARCIHFFRKE